MGASFVPAETKPEDIALTDVVFRETGGSEIDWERIVRFLMKQESKDLSN